MLQTSENSEAIGNDRTRTPIGAWLVVAACAFIAALTVLDYGISWDEPLQSAYGEMVIDSFESGLSDRRFETFLNLRYYGPIFEMLPALVYRHAPYWKYETRHIFIASFALLGLAATVLIAARVTGFRHGPLFAAVAVAGMPAVSGHAFFNSKDIPFAALVAWSMLALLRFVEAPNWKRAAILGVTSGLALGIRVGGLVIFAIAAVALLVHAFAGRSAARDLARPLVRLGVAGAIAWIVMVILWPWTYANPIGRPLEALRSAVAFASKIEVRFAGESLMNDELPRTYLAHMFGVTTPLPTLTLVCGGVLLMLRRIVRREAPFGGVLVFVWALLPPLIQFGTRSPVYDGTRHFLFVYPPLAILAAMAGAALVKGLPQPRIASAGVAVALLSAVPAMVRLHPYQYVYYNELLGGVGGAADDYETDYWTTSYREAALWAAGHPCGTRPVSVLIAGDEFNAPAATYFLPPDAIVRTSFLYGIPGKLPAEIDYYIATRRQRMDANFPGSPIAYSIVRMGATLGVVRGGCGREFAHSADLRHNRP